MFYSWRFSRYSAPIHWLVNGHMTSNNETVYRQMPWAANIAKTMMSNGKQFTFAREMLTGVARDQSVELKVAWCCRRNIRAFFKICFCFYQAFLLYNKYIESQCFPRRSRGKQNSLFPSGPVIKCILSIGPAFSNNEVQQGGKGRNWELRSVTAERSAKKCCPLCDKQVIASALGQLRINFTCIFKVFPTRPILGKLWKYAWN